MLDEQLTPDVQEKIKRAAVAALARSRAVLRLQQEGWRNANGKSAVFDWASRKVVEDIFSGANREYEEAIKGLSSADLLRVEERIAEMKRETVHDK